MLRTDIILLGEFQLAVDKEHADRAFGLDLCQFGALGLGALEPIGFQFLFFRLVGVRGDFERLERQRRLAEQRIAFAVPEQPARNAEPWIGQVSDFFERRDRAVVVTGDRVGLGLADQERRVLRLRRKGFFEHGAAAG